jgi:hypothetical protein
MLGWQDILAYQERYKDRLREAERDRLVLHELALRHKSDSFHRRAMTWLGRGLVAWGWHLQERYGTMVEVPTLQSAHCTERTNERWCA